MHKNSINKSILHEKAPPLNFSKFNPKRPQPSASEKKNPKCIWGVVYNKINGYKYVVGLK